MGELSNVNAVAHVIRLSVAPVFLLSGIGAILAVMASRLARIIDRARVLETRLEQATPETAVTVREDLVTLRQRAKLIGPAITLCTATALLVCTVIAGLFLEVLMGLDLRWMIGVVFTLAMIALIVGLAYFLREVHLATTTIRIRFTAGRRT